MVYRHCKNTIGSYVCLSDEGLSDWWCDTQPGTCGKMDPMAKCAASGSQGLDENTIAADIEYKCICSAGYANTDPDADPTVNPVHAQCHDHVDCFPGSSEIRGFTLMFYEYDAGS